MCFQCGRRRYFPNFNSKQSRAGRRRAKAKRYAVTAEAEGFLSTMQNLMMFGISPLKFK